jgi:predicted DNA-binding transcriptional regulator AlpA
MADDPSPADRPPPFVGRMRRPRQIKTPEQRLAQMVNHLEVVKALGVSVDTFRRWVNADPPKFPPPKLKIGARWYYLESDLKRYWATGKWE